MKRKTPKYSNISNLQSFASNQDAKDYVFTALLRNAQVAVWLADTGNWVVSVTELADLATACKGVTL